MSRKRKILMTSFDYRPRLGGVATLGFGLSKAYAELEDTEFTVLTPRAAGMEKYDQSVSFKVVRFPCPKNAMLAILPLTFFLALNLIRFRPNYLITFLWLPSGLAALILWPLTKILGVKKIAFAMGVEVLESKASVRKRIRSLLAPFKILSFKTSEFVFAISRYTQSLLVKHCRIKKENIALMYVGTDATDFVPAEKSQKLLDKYQLHNSYVILTTTRLDDYKGVDFTMRAIAELLPQYPNIKYIVCGEGGDLHRLMTIRTDLHLEKQVIFAGKIADEELVEYFNLADCFALLSREDLITPNVEGFGIVYLEANACEVPVIGGATGGVTDAIADGQSGLLVDPESVAKISEAIERIIEDTAFAKKLGEQGRKRTIEEFNWPNVVKRIEAVIRP